jgi:hypothetical protein
VELKGVRGGVVRRRGVRVGIETSEGWCAERDDRREMIKSSRNGVHRANGIVRGPARYYHPQNAPETGAAGS